MRALLLVVLSSSWHPGAPMNVPREDHSATVLLDGGVLVVGGRPIDGGALASAELYDERLNQWTLVGSMAEARERHTATLLPNGLLLVTGGIGNGSSYLASAELYDPATQTWSDAGALSTPRVGHRATLLADGRVLVSGGFMNGVVDTVDLYEHPGQWTRGAAMARPRDGHTAVLLRDGRVLAAGGWVGNAATTTTELFDPDAGTWQAGPMLNLARREAMGVRLGSGEVLICGGANATFNDVAANELLAAPGFDQFIPLPFNLERFYGSAVKLKDGRVLVAGGSDLFREGPVQRAEIFEPVTKAWLDGGHLGSARTLQAAVLLPRGQVLVAGGRIGSVITASTELFDPTAGQPCSNAAGCASGNCIDFVCCDTPCAGPCEACDLPGREGTCTARPALHAGAPSCAPAKCAGDAGTCSTFCASDLECVASTFCAPDGQCLPRSAIGSPCDAGNRCLGGFCADGVCCSGSCEGSCNVCNAEGKAGTCVLLPEGAEGSPSCGNYFCSGTSEKCRGVCRNDADCANGLKCGGGTCGYTPKPFKSCGCEGAPGLAVLLAALLLLRARTSSLSPVREANGWGRGPG